MCEVVSFIWKVTKYQLKINSVFLNDQWLFVRYTIHCWGAGACIFEFMWSFRLLPIFHSVILVRIGPILILNTPLANTLSGFIHTSFVWVLEKLHDLQPGLKSKGAETFSHSRSWLTWDIIWTFSAQTQVVNSLFWPHFSCKLLPCKGIAFKAISFALCWDGLSATFELAFTGLIFPLKALFRSTGLSALLHASSTPQTCSEKNTLGSFWLGQITGKRRCSKETFHWY